MLSHLPPFFLFFCVLLRTTLEPRPFQQKYVLQKRNSQGHFVRVTSSDKPVSREEVQREFGDGYFILRSCIPRFATTWKGWVGQSEPQHDDMSPDALLKLERKTRYLAYGTVATAVGEAVGFGLTHLRFKSLENRVAQAIAIIRTLPALGLSCPNCGVKVDNMLQTRCVSCSSELIWPRERPPTLPTTQLGSCRKCGWPLQAHWKFCSNCGNSLYAPTPTVCFILP